LTSWTLFNLSCADFPLAALREFAGPVGLAAVASK